MSPANHSSSSSEQPQLQPPVAVDPTALAAASLQQLLSVQEKLRELQEREKKLRLAGSKADPQDDAAAAGAGEAGDDEGGGRRISGRKRKRAQHKYELEDDEEAGGNENGDAIDDDDEEEEAVATRHGKQQQALVAGRRGQQASPTKEPANKRQGHSPSRPKAQSHQPAVSTKPKPAAGGSKGSAASASQPPKQEKGRERRPAPKDPATAYDSDGNPEVQTGEDGRVIRLFELPWLDGAGNTGHGGHKRRKRSSSAVDGVGSANVALPGSNSFATVAHAKRGLAYELSEGSMIQCPCCSERRAAIMKKLRLIAPIEAAAIERGTVAGGVGTSSAIAAAVTAAPMSAVEARSASINAANVKFVECIRKAWGTTHWEDAAKDSHGYGKVKGYYSGGIAKRSNGASKSSSINSSNGGSSKKKEAKKQDSSASSSSASSSSSATTDNAASENNNDNSNSEQYDPIVLRKVADDLFGRRATVKWADGNNSTMRSAAAAGVTGATTSGASSSGSGVGAGLLGGSIRRAEDSDSSDCDEDGNEKGEDEKLCSGMRFEAAAVLVCGLTEVQPFLTERRSKKSKSSALSSSSAADGSAPLAPARKSSRAPKPKTYFLDELGGRRANTGKGRTTDDADEQMQEPEEGDNNDEAAVAAPTSSVDADNGAIAVGGEEAFATETVVVSSTEQAGPEPQEGTKAVSVSQASDISPEPAPAADAAPSSSSSQEPSAPAELQPPILPASEPMEEEEDVASSNAAGIPTTEAAAAAEEEVAGPVAVSQELIQEGPAASESETKAAPSSSDGSAGDMDIAADAHDAANMSSLWAEDENTAAEGPVPMAVEAAAAAPIVVEAALTEAEAAAPPAPGPADAAPAAPLPVPPPTRASRSRAASRPASSSSSSSSSSSTAAASSSTSASSSAPSGPKILFVDISSILPFAEPLDAPDEGLSLLNANSSSSSSGDATKADGDGDARGAAVVAAVGGIAAGRVTRGSVLNSALATGSGSSAASLLFNVDDAIEHLLRIDYTAPHILRDIPGRGRCVYAAGFIPKGAFVAEYGGQLITQKEATRREGLYASEGLGSYMFFFEHAGQGHCVDATAERREYGVGRLINHSRKNPNLNPRKVVVDGVPRIALMAKRNITYGEELAYDYGERDSAALKVFSWLKA